MDDWDECLLENVVLEKTPDLQRVQSLRTVAKKRFEFLEKQKINSLSVNFLFESLYTSILLFNNILTL